MARSWLRLVIASDCIEMHQTAIRCSLMYITTVLLTTVVILFIDGFAGAPAGEWADWLMGGLAEGRPVRQAGERTD